MNFTAAADELRLQEFARLSAAVTPAQDPRREELWSLTPSGRRIVDDVLMRRRRQTGGPRSACLTQCRSEKGPASRISLTAT
jgi:hypothetical protein